MAYSIVKEMRINRIQTEFIVIEIREMVSFYHLRIFFISEGDSEFFTLSHTWDKMKKPFAVIYNVLHHYKQIPEPLSQQHYHASV